jgi:prepilin signal peptidase PulO-like enzyme (type II secretory pathway)
MSEFINIFNYAISIYFGLIIGNFATTFYFRVPRGISLLGMVGGENSVPPHCHSCKHLLKLKDYVPIFGYISCKGRCRYCGANIDKNYFIIELVSVLVSLFCYHQFYFLDWYLIFLFFGITSLMSSLLLFKNNKIPKEFIVFMGFLGVIYNTLVFIGIYDWVFKLVFAFVIWMLINSKFKHILYNNKDLYELMKLLFISLIWFDLNIMIAYYLFITVVYYMRKKFCAKFVDVMYCYGYLLIFIVAFFNHLQKF